METHMANDDIANQTRKIDPISTLVHYNPTGQNILGHVGLGGADGQILKNKI